MDNRQILSEIIVQILGFLAVFAILKRFAWSKLLGAIDSRRKTIEDALADAEKKKRDMEALEKEYRGRLERIEQEARGKIQEAAGIGMALARDIQDKARADAQGIVDRAHEEIRQDIARARLSLRNEIVDLSGLIAEKAIGERLDAKEHGRLVDQFIKELEKIQ